MPQTKTARKALRQTVKKTARNLEKKKKIEFLTRNIKKAMAGKNLEEVGKIFKELQKAVDKAAKTKVISLNKASRTKSRLQKKIRSLGK